MSSKTPRVGQPVRYDINDDEPGAPATVYIINADGTCRLVVWDHRMRCHVEIDDVPRARPDNADRAHWHPLDED